MKRLFLIIILILIFLTALFFIFFNKKEPLKSPLGPRLVKGTLILLDSSVSMRGYFAVSSPNAPLGVSQSFFLRELRNILSGNNLNPVRLSFFAETVHQPKEINERLPQIFNFQSQGEINNTFSGRSTDLIGAINTATASNKTISLIITDGIQDEAGGFDIGDMLQTITTKIRDGYSFNLVGIKSEFNGYVFPGQINCRSFRYNGLRPIYLWIISKDHKISENLTKQIMKSISQLGNCDHIKTARLAYVHLQVVKSIHLEEGMNKLIRVKNSNNKIELRLSNSVREDITIPLIVDSENNINEWNLEVRLESDRPWARIVREDHRWFLRLTYKALPGSSQVTIKTFAIPVPDHWWWKNWGTNNGCGSEDADKTLYLGRLGDQFLTPQHSKKHEIHSTELRILK